MNKNIFIVGDSNVFLMSGHPDATIYMNSSFDTDIENNLKHIENIYPRKSYKAFYNIENNATYCWGIARSIFELNIDLLEKMLAGYLHLLNESMVVFCFGTIDTKAIGYLYKHNNHYELALKYVEVIDDFAKKYNFNYLISEPINTPEHKQNVNIFLEKLESIPGIAKKIIRYPQELNNLNYIPYDKHEHMDINGLNKISEYILTTVRGTN